MPKAPVLKPSSTRSVSSSSGSSTNDRRSRWILLLTAFGSFIVGRTTQQQLSWSQADFVSQIKPNLGDPSGSSSAGRPSTSTNTSGMHVNLHMPYTNKRLHLLEDAPFRVNDRTLRLSPHVDHLWLHNGNFLPELPQAEKPTTKLILTDFGWNHPDPEQGKKFVRSMRLTEIMTAVINHPFFDPTFQWTEMEKGNLRFNHNLQYFVFLDVETCFESNYPYYKSNFAFNFDAAGGRDFSTPHQNQCFDIGNCDAIQRVLDSPLFQQVPTARFFFFDCRGYGPTVSFRRDTQKSDQLVLVSISSGAEQHNPNSDMGQPPPPIMPVRLTYMERKSIMETCDNDEDPLLRPYFLSCVGTVRNTVREKLNKFNDPSKGLLLVDPVVFDQHYTHNVTYTQVMSKSVFSATPRGDNKFSYRFTEVMSAGAIPVVHSDDWILPFRKEFIDWGNECAIIIPEADVEQTLQILYSISPQERCRRRRRCYEIYTKYMANPEGTIAGVLESTKLTIAAAEARRKIGSSNQ